MDENQMEFEPSDGSMQMDKIMDGLIFEEAVVTILTNLEMREKLIFLFQLLRDNGYQIDHASFAKVINLSRRQYMRVLEEVRLKSWLYLEGYKKHCQIDDSHKEA